MAFRDELAARGDAAPRQCLPRECQRLSSRGVPIMSMLQFSMYSTYNILYLCDKNAKGEGIVDSHFVGERRSELRTRVS